MFESWSCNFQIVGFIFHMLMSFLWLVHFEQVFGSECQVKFIGYFWNTLNLKVIKLIEWKNRK